MATLAVIAPVTLNNDEILRYSRHLIMPEVGMQGQLKIKAAKILCNGAGGLGSPLALYLGAAGVGSPARVDLEVVGYPNPSRQIIHHIAELGRAQIDFITEKLEAKDPVLNNNAINMALSKV